MKKAVDLVMGVGAAAKEYFLYPDDASGNLIHGKDKPNVPMNASGGTPVQSGGVYDVRDTEGDKAITHLDWAQGEGQRTLDSEDSVYSRYLEGSYVDVSTKGQLKLLRPVVNTPAPNTTGPVFSAMGYLWLGSDLGGLAYSGDDGVTWTDAVIEGTPITSTISGFATDGTHLYFCVQSGASLGIWVNKAVIAPKTFEEFTGNVPDTPGAGTNAAVQALAFNGGLLFAATADGAGLVDVATGVYTKKTPAFLNVANTTVTLVSAANSVHWVVSQGGRSYVYKLTYDPNTDPPVMKTEQEAEFPDGFVATCAVGYLGNVDVGGYFESSIGGVGQGAVYRVAGGMSTLLFEIGDLPESTPVPTDVGNNNRIKAACSGAKDEYFLTDRACYRWDIDDGGHSHVFDFLGAGSDARVTADTGYADLLPTGGTITTVGQYTIHTFNSSGSLIVGTHTDKEGNIISTIPAEVLVVAGGGGGGFEGFGGGGAGGFLEGAQVLTGGMTVTVGVGGAVTSIGADSIFGTRTAKGGGLGGASGQNGGNGGSGGGGGLGGGATLGGSGITGQGHAGATGGSGRSGGGGGAGSAATWYGGGWGISRGISGVMRQYAGGGAGITMGPPMVGGIGVAGGGSFGVAGSPNTGGGGGGRAAGGKGVVIVRYLTKDAVSSKRQLSGDLFHPSIAYSRGKIFAPYAEAESSQVVTILANSVAASTIVLTETHYGYPLHPGEMIHITGSDSTPSIDGLHVATYIDPTHFSIPVNVTVAGTAGYVFWNSNVGWTVTSAGYNEIGWLTQSPTTFHTGSMLKDFRYISVAHDALPEGGTIRPASWLIDGVYGTSNGVVYGPQETRFVIDQQGYSIEPTIGVTPDNTLSISPIVRGINVVWDFVKTPKHTYVLDCRQGAGNGRWKENPEEAIAALFQAADTPATFEDRYNGVYTGVIDKIEFKQAARSLTEGPSGIVTISVREVL